MNRLRASRGERPAKNASRGGAPSEPQISPAERERRFAALLRRRCLEAAAAAGIQALSELLPGLKPATRLLVRRGDPSVAAAERRLEVAFEVFELYALRLRAREKAAMRKVLERLAQASVASAERAADAVARRLATELGGPFARHALPLLRVFSAAAAAVFATYAVARRAQALARLADPALEDLPSFLRDLSGVDEARLIAWTSEGLKQVLGPLRGGASEMVSLAKLAARLAVGR